MEIFRLSSSYAAQFLVGAVVEGYLLVASVKLSKATGRGVILRIVKAHGEAFGVRIAHCYVLNHQLS